MQKISIKREQSQAGLSFAERLRVGEPCSGMRKKFRPQVKNRLLLLLALLLTAATGAWADTVVLGSPNESVTTLSDGNGIITISDASGSTGIQQGSGGYKISYGDKEYIPMKLSGSRNFTLSFKAGVTINKVTLMAMSNGDSEGTVGGGNGDNSSLGTFPSRNSNGNCVTLDITNNTGLRFSRQALAIIVVEYSTTSTVAPAVPKHLIKATYREQTRSLEQPLPYATTIGELYEAVTGGQSFSDLISSMSAVEMPLTGITSRNTSVVSIGELNGASTPVTVKADGEAIISLIFGSYAQGIFVSVTSPLYAYVKDDVKDADKWTVKVGEGQAQALPIGGLKGDGSETVTLQYNGRLKVKGVKATSDAAPAAKTPATVTTAPTGAAIVGVGKNTALVSGGAADGGTLMYAVTTTNTMPTSTAGFSDAVPTAQTITASGKVYVWYFVKADDTHTDSEIAATAIEVPVADIVWDVTNISDLEVPGTGQYEKEGVTLSGNGELVQAAWINWGDPETDGISFNIDEPGSFTFTAPAGKAFTKIEMKPLGSVGWDIAYEDEKLGDGWTFVNYLDKIFTVTWKGSAAASTVGLLTGADMFQGATISYIAFYLSE